MYDERHGGPYDRGSCDKYYNRPFEPHYYEGDTYNSKRVELKDMTPNEIVEYSAGYRDTTDQKVW